MKFTGEQFIPDQTSRRMEQDHVERYKFAAKFVEDKDVLDMACGAGYGTKLLKEAGAKSVDGVDISPEIINYARTRYAVGGINFFVSDAIKYTSNKKYDVIVSFETIEHIQDYKALLNNFFRLLGEDGLLIISSPNREITSPSLNSISDKPYSKFHVREFIVPELIKELNECGFVTEGDCVFGQRQQAHFRNKYLRRLYKIIFNPDIKKSPIVTKIKKTPRYFIVKAIKNNFRSYVF